ncbi:hypothetical protein HanRHA438_Chr08g0352951 [Helianthus annuus]|nr:hypothetical protein HanRHA438_Chr08g0352951 [Helianthus annuus]
MMSNFDLGLVAADAWSSSFSSDFGYYFGLFQVTQGSGMEERFSSGFGSGSTASTQQVDRSTLVNESQLVSRGSGSVRQVRSWFGSTGSVR